MFKKPLVLGTNGQLEELQSGDYITDPTPDLITLTSDEAIAIRDAIYVNPTNGQVKKAVASAIGTMPAIGFALEAAAAAGQAIKIQVDGIVPGFTGLDIGAIYFVDQTAGQITSTAPTGAGKVVQPVGIAVSETELEVNIGYPIKRG